MRIIPIVISLMMLSACSLWGEKEDETINMSAERLYNEARGALDSRNYQRSIDLYEKLESRFPFGRYAQQALLDLAYAYYKNEEADAAIAASDRFIKL